MEDLIGTHLEKVQKYIIILYNLLNIIIFFLIKLKEYLNYNNKFIYIRHYQLYG